MPGSPTRTRYALLSANAPHAVVPQQPRDMHSLYATYRFKIAEGVSDGVAGCLYGRSSSFANLLGQHVVPASRQVVSD
ncbi:hypothetical protein [Sphingomonas pokkalii]|uniref:Uncharacterized protein n=1 Tax=Sphingomonas pokkalii TaxID=2175090 RepID=A0A2U0S9L0_9SPHN|nr:hypothetical protein [Sphingomonas pokkalii]PVX28058.1 hypothetical protein DD559_00765 [Sphingomonas pokkalii]